MSWTFWVVAGSFFGGTAVLLGAFAAHMLRAQLSAEHLAVFETAVRYQMYHALALLGLAAVASRIENHWMQVAGSCFSVGILFFSGSLYLLVWADMRSLGMVTPVGGLLFMIGWAALAYGTLNP